MHCFSIRRICFCTLLATLAATQGVAQQISDITPPPSAAAVSPGGVNYQYGSFEYSREWLTVGSGDFPAQMSFRTTYSSSADSRLSPLGKTSHNWGASLYRVAIDKTPGPYPSDWICATYISVGNRSDSFEKVGCGNAGNYDYGLYRGATLEFAANAFLYTMKNGGTATFPSSEFALYVALDKWTEPDGTQFTFGYANGKLASVFSNRGYGFIFENGTSTTKVCAVSLAKDFLVNGSLCPAGAPAVTITLTSGNVSSILDATGGTWTFQYSPNTTTRMTCYKEPGSSACRVANSWQPAGDDKTGRVGSQRFADGTSLAYGYQSSRNALPTDPDPWLYFNHQTTVTDGSGAVTQLGVGGGNSGMLPIWVQDPLLRRTDLTYAADESLSDIKYPESNEIVMLFDDRYNPTERRQKPKPGSALADIVTQASYPASSGTIGMFPKCTYPKSCNRASSVTDARGNTTNYTFDNVHGGMLTETRPAVNGVRPQVRYEYAQRYAWIKNSGGTYSQAASPVWLLVRERFCRTTAASGQSCAGGAADEVITDYDFGPNSGPNNLFLRGKAIAADGVTLRSCYSYDAYGRRISETRPNANLATCP